MKILKQIQRLFKKTTADSSLHGDKFYSALGATESAEELTELDRLWLRIARRMKSNPEEWVPGEKPWTAGMSDLDYRFHHATGLEVVYWRARYSCTNEVNLYPEVELNESVKREVIRAIYDNLVVPAEARVELEAKEKLNKKYSAALDYFHE